MNVSFETGVSMKTEPLYKKVGRKYVPVSANWAEDSRMESMAVGTFRLTYAYADGARRYEYDVTPATAPAAAAMLVAKHAMCEAIKEASRMRPQAVHKYTAKQQAALAKFREDMGGMMPSWWTENFDYAVADAAIKAVLEFKP